MYKGNEPLLILTVGGIGDLLCAEPAIRYGLKYVFTQSDRIIIVTKCPEIFYHLQDSRVEFITEEELYKSLSSYKGWSVCATYEHPLFMKKGIIQGAMHSTDYASIYLLGRLVPEKHRKIHIVPPSGREKYTVKEKFQQLGLNPSETLLVHPGETWPSRTIPADWWEHFIKKYPGSVCLIGKHRSDNVPLMTESPSRIPKETDESHRDYVPGVLDLNTDAPSLIDKLSFRELVTAIYLCKAVITNDSMPIHVAAAFGTDLFTFATAREWSILHPYEHPNSYNLASGCLYPAEHFRPTKLIGSHDLLPSDVSSIKEVLTSPDITISFIQQLL